MVDLIGQRIREIRLRNGWTQREVGGWCDISEAQIAQFEGGRTPSVRNFIKLGQGLRVSLDRLAGLAPAGADDAPRSNASA